MLSLWLVIGVVFVLYAVLFVYKTKTGSPYLPSDDEDVSVMMRYVKKGDVVCDLGAGDGGLLVESVMHGAKEAWGWEIEPLVWLKGVMNIRTKYSEIKGRVKLRFGDMWKVRFDRFDVLLVYQLERFTDKLAVKCKNEMKPGSLVIANRYPIKDLRLRKRDGNVFVYEV